MGPWMKPFVNSPFIYHVSQENIGIVSSQRSKKVMYSFYYQKHKIRRDLFIVRRNIIFTKMRTFCLQPIEKKLRNWRTFCLQPVKK